MTLDDFYRRYNGQQLTNNNGNYRGECVSLAARYAQEVLGVPNGDGVLYCSNVGGARDLYEQYDGSLPRYFDRIPFGQPRQRGDLVVWGTNLGYYGDVAIALDGGNQVFGQLGTPVFQPAGIRNETRQPLGYLRLKGQGDTSMTIGSGDNWRARMNRFHHQLVRNADMSDEVFRSIIGRDTWEVLESWSDHDESNQLLQDQVVGELARRDNWAGQIYGLQDTVKSLSSRPTKEELQAALGQVQKITTELAASRDEAVASQEKVKELEAQKTEDTKLLDDAGGIFTRLLNRFRKK